MYSASDIQYLERMAFQDLSKALKDLDPYMTVDNRTKTTTFDVEGARRARVPGPIIKLAEESVEYQNLTMQEIINSSRNMDVTDIEFPLDEFPLHRRFRNRAIAHMISIERIAPSSEDVPEEEARNNSGGGQARVVTREACGDWDNPIPNHRPTRYHFTVQNARQHLLHNGYHRTAAYACGNCENDYTHPRSHTSPHHGTCDSPLFRNHGRVHSHKEYSVQYGEPNAEVFATAHWPYWNWPQYVNWWHETH